MTIERASELLALRNTALTDTDWERLREACETDPDVRVRSAALTVIAETDNPDRVIAALTRAAGDDAPALRRRVGELAGAHPFSDLGPMLLTLLADADSTVAEAAAAALGELPTDAADHDTIVSSLSANATGHEDPLVREAAVAALGSIGDPAGLAAILQGCSDKPAIRRRAVLALAPFEGPEVEAAIDTALTDRDWQTRQAAELLREEAGD